MTPPDRRTVLVVDDTPENIAVASSVLREKYRVKVATGGVAAMRVMRDAAPPDLVLLDVIMPDMDGFAVCAEMKADPTLRDIPVIFLTADGSVEAEQRGFALGAVDFMTKPMSPPKLLARVAAHLELADARRALARQNAALLEAARLRDDVDGILRHDLKSPLNAIIGFPALIMEREDVPEKVKGMAQAIESAGYQMLDQINRSLDVFKMETGRYDLEPFPVDLGQTLRGVMDEHTRYAQERHVRMELTGGACALGEEFLLRCLFGNLVKNALEAAPSGSLVTILLRQEGGRAVATVANDGEIPEDIRDRFFQKYATSGKRGGTGLGAYSARLMAETMQGRLTLEQKPGRVLIHVILPVGDGAAA